MTDISGQRSHELFQALARSIKIVSAPAIPFREQLNQFLAILLPQVGSARGSLMLIDGEKLTVQAATEPDIIGYTQSLNDDSIAVQAIRSRRPLFDENAHERHDERGYKTASFLTIPIVFMDEAIGVINVTDKVDRSAFGENDEEVISLFTGVVVSALLERTVERERDRLHIANQKLEELERLKENLTHMIVHDLKGPAGEMKANLDMLEGMVDDPFAKETLADAISANDNLFAMIINILDVSRMEEGKFHPQKAPFDIIPLLTTLMNRTARAAERDGKTALLETVLPSLTVNADRGVIERVLWNLSSNALNHTDEGERVTVKCWNDATTLFVSVSDNGKGIKPEFLDVIFDKFTQAEQSETKYSTGLGLSFCKMAMRAHGGDITVASVEGEGATFTITLPLR